MADIQLTMSQQAVIDHQGGPLLVSAAAGSGKTKVLVERILQKINSTNDPCNIDDFLVITYTKAAASELRVKIAQAINEKLSVNPGNRHLQKQLNRLYLADISTVHSFCSNLIRNYSHQLGLSNDFTVMDETESRIFREECLNRFLEHEYSCGKSDFLAMVGLFGYGRNDNRLVQAILSMHNELRCRPNMKKWAEDMETIMNPERYASVDQTPWGSYLVKLFRKFLADQIEQLEQTASEIKMYPNINKAYMPTIQACMDSLNTYRSCESWDDIVENKIQKFPSLGQLRKPEDILLKKRVIQIKDICWKSLKKWQDMFSGPSSVIMNDLRSIYPGSSALLRYTIAFEDMYRKEKNKRGIFDFADLEHMAIELLTDPYTGRPTHTAMEISSHYKEIMVDEYQDSNEVQEVIFDAISRKGQNRFMVGDVKQSIYRFRLANPNLFLRKYKSYKCTECNYSTEPRKILLSENFRSRPEVLAACNDIFSLIMRPSVGDILYGEEEKLKQGKVFPGVLKDPIELHCLSAEKGTSMKKEEAEPKFVAVRIKQMISDGELITDGNSIRSVEPKDIVILVRALSSVAEEYICALKEQGIPVSCSQSADLLKTDEIQILVAFLQILDNPHQDIPLLSVLASPIFGFSLDQIAKPRIDNSKKDYFDSIKDSVEFREFLLLLDELRRDSHRMQLSDFIYRLMEKTNMRHIFSAMEDGAQRERNLSAFCIFVQNFELSGKQSLPQLLWYLDDLTSSGGCIPVSEGAVENAVTLMTIHSAKGLEFPVVFLCDLSHGFNHEDQINALQIDNELSIGCNYVDLEQCIYRSTAVKNAIKLKKQRESLSEELRILYVAMTRAKDRLVMTYYSKSLIKDLEKLSSLLTVPISDLLCSSVSCPGEWILIAALCRTEAGELFSLCGNNSAAQTWDTIWKIRYTNMTEWSGDPCEKQEYNGVPVGTKLEESEKMIWYRYPYMEISHIPGKITATQLKGRMADMEASKDASDLITTSAFRFRRPMFSAAPLSQKERGTATHLYLQFADYRCCTNVKDVAQELNRLVQKQFLTQEQADGVAQEQIVRLFSSPLGEWLLEQNPVREFKFSVIVPGDLYTNAPKQEEVLLQGVIDCFVAEPDGITVIDFKTDRHPRPEYYHTQLTVYGTALSRIYNLPIKIMYVYFFETGDTYTIVPDVSD